MRKSKLIFILLLSLNITLFYTGCFKKNNTNHKYTFIGESKNWTANYEIIDESDSLNKDNSNNGTKYLSIFTITYKEDISELSSVKKLSYSFESNAGKGEHEIPFEQPPTEKVFKHRSEIEGVMPDKSDVIKVKVTLDDKTETFDLKCKN